jgi:ABC-type transport system substrate-binding protein
MERGGEVTDPEERLEIYRDITNILAEDPFAIYLIIPNDLYGVSAQVQNFTPRADQVLWLHDVYKE